MLKTIFVFITITHGLIHFIGFAKAFNYINIFQLAKEIAKPIGLLWLITGCLFLLSMLFYSFKKEQWMYFAFGAIVLSQMLIIINWQAAKYGTIINILIFTISIIGFFQTRFKNIYKKEVNKGLVESIALPKNLLTETTIAHLPLQVRKYIHYTGFANKPIINNFKINFKGKIRNHAKPVWVPLTTEQYNFIKTPTRLFYFNATMKGLPVSGFHCFKNGVAYMDIRLLSIFKVEYQSGAVMNISETVTFFNDMCVLAPGALIDKRIKWLEYEENIVSASFTNNNITISALLHFNEKGELVNFTSKDRSALGENGKTEKLKWSTPLRDYKSINGYKLATYAEAIYTYPTGDFTYATFELKNISYNLLK